LPGEVLHRDERYTAVFADLMDLDNVIVRDGCRSASFTQKTLFGLWFRRDTGTHHLERDQTPRRMSSALNTIPMPPTPNTFSTR
jgi:hypothetical protein